MKSEPISLLMFSNATVRAGAEEHIMQLLQGLDRAYFRLHLACPPELARLLKPDLPADVKLCCVTLDSLSDITGAIELMRIFREHRIQILHSHTFRASLFASPLGWLARIPVVVETAHVREVWRKGWKASYVLDRFAAHFVDRTIAVSNAIARYLVEEKGIPEEKIAVIRTAPVLHKFNGDIRSRQEHKHALGFPDTDPLLIVAGRLESQKGHRMLIEAMPQVLQEFPKARVVFLGEGSLRAELEAMVAARALGQNIRFAGYRTDVWSWFAAADLSVLPSFYEGLPMTALESLVAGCPIVATAVDGTPEVVLHGKTGLLVPPGDPQPLAEAIRTMLRNRELAREMALTGQKFVLENFSVEKLIRSTEELYLDVWEQRRRGRRRDTSDASTWPKARRSGGDETVKQKSATLPRGEAARARLTVDKV